MALNLTTEIRTCPTCGDEYEPVSNRQRWCVGCVPTREWTHRIRRYGVSYKDWTRMLAAQGGTCALCPAVPDCVDHDHETGEVRGLLCRCCNMLLSRVPGDWFHRAQAYLEGGSH